MRLLGLDMGEKRIGVAASDELNSMAHSIGFIERRSDAHVFEAVQKYVRDFSIGKIVVGLPKTMKGEIGPQAEGVLLFVDRLKNHCSCPIVAWDERLTTSQAERTLVAQDMSRAKRRVKRDAIAAEIILQSYLDFLHTEGKN